MACWRGGCVRHEVAFDGVSIHAEVGAQCFALALYPGHISGLGQIVCAASAQATAFGAFLDVAVDCFSRAVVWACAVGPWAALPITLELLTFVCTHKACPPSVPSYRPYLTTVTAPTSDTRDTCPSTLLLPAQGVLACLMPCRCDICHA